MTATKGRRWRPSAPANRQKRHRLATLAIAPFLLLAAAVMQLAAWASGGSYARSRHADGRIAYRGAAGGRARLDGNALLRQSGHSIPYGITPAHLFMKGITTIHPLPATDSSSFCAAQDCGF